MVKITVNSPNQIFGNKVINLKKLYKNQVTLRYRNYTRINKYNRVEISDTLVGIILEIIHDKKFNYQLIQKLSESELDFFETMIKDTGLYIILQYDKSKRRDDSIELLQRYKVLIGEINAGNDNNALLEEMQQISYELYKNGKLSREQLIKNLSNSI
jgi:hypothetical protein